jgi:hypothetical protein
MRFRDDSHSDYAKKCCTNLRKTTTETLAVIRKAFECFNGQVQIHRDQEARQVRNIVKSKLIISADCS